MKKVSLIMLLVVSLLAMVGFTSVEASYWAQMKEMYEWNAMEGTSEADIKLSIPNMNGEYKVYTTSQSNLKDFSSYSEIKVEGVQGIKFPTIKMYTNGGDIYINKAAAAPFLSVLGVDLKEDYILLESGQGVDLNTNILNDSIKFIEEMDLGIDLGMKQDGNTYSLTLDSGKLVDLLDAYMIYSLENADKLPNAQEVTISEAEKQEALKAYNEFVGAYKDMAKLLIAGSKYNQQVTFGADKYNEDSQLVINTPVGNISVNTVAATSKLDAPTFKLPTSVKRISAEELEVLMAPVEAFAGGAKAIFRLDGSYVKLSGTTFEVGSIPMKVVDGKAYIRTQEASKIFNTSLSGLDSSFHIRELNGYGLNVKWNDAARTIEVY